jgi:hypothetical protein
MKTNLTPERLRELLHYDSETGRFTWRVDRSPRVKAGDRPQAPTAAGYFRAGIDGQLHYLHRLAWLYVHGVWPAGVIDHINGDVQDNRIENLRDVPHVVNMQNLKRARRDNGTKLLGVYFRKDTGRYSASIKTPERSLALGCFDTAEEAHTAYINAKRNMHQGCTI